MQCFNLCFLSLYILSYPICIEILTKAAMLRVALKLISLQILNKKEEVI